MAHRLNYTAVQGIIPDMLKEKYNTSTYMYTRGSMLNSATVSGYINVVSAVGIL